MGKSVMIEEYNPEWAVYRLFFDNVGFFLIKQSGQIVQ